MRIKCDMNLEEASEKLTITFDNDKFMLAKVDKAIATISLADIEKNCERIDSQARADQSKKIGEYIEHWYDEWDDISSWNAMRRFVSQLELGKFSPEGEK